MRWEHWVFLVGITFKLVQKLVQRILLEVEKEVATDETPAGQYNTLRERRTLGGKWGPPPLVREHQCESG